MNNGDWVRPEVKDLEGGRAGFAAEKVTSSVTTDTAFRADRIRGLPNTHPVRQKTDAGVGAKLSCI